MANTRQTPSTVQTRAGKFGAAESRAESQRRPIPIKQAMRALTRGEFQAAYVLVADCFKKPRF
jgi:hypothetical protein